jgi:hypothetical protein
MTIPESTKGGTPMKKRILILSHFKGHQMAGFGGAVKNISIGIGSSEGKAWIHSGGTSRRNPWGGKQDDFLKCMAEAGNRFPTPSAMGKTLSISM